MQMEVLETLLSRQVYVQFEQLGLFTQLRFRLSDTFFDVDEPTLRAYSLKVRQPIV